MAQLPAQRPNHQHAPRRASGLAPSRHDPSVGRRAAKGRAVPIPANDNRRPLLTTFRRLSGWAIVAVALAAVGYWVG